MRQLRFAWLLLLLIPFIPWIVWELQTSHGLGVLVVDKTVPDITRRGHSSFFWCLEHYRVLRPDGYYYNKMTDYYGYFPEDSTVSDPSSLGGLRPDLVYVTDLYGIYRSDQDHPGKEVGSRLVYGGLEQRELDAFRSYDSSGATMIAEFNSLDYPTTLRPEIDSMFQRMMDVRYDGWYGSFYQNLLDVPAWVRSMYTQFNRRPWRFSGSGVVLLNQGSLQKSKRGIIVLGKNDLLYPQLTVESSSDPTLTGTSQSVPYFSRFELVQPDSGGDVIASYRLNVSYAGAAKLEQAGWPRTFPAVITNGARTHFYFAGDFAVNDAPGILKQLAFVQRFSQFAYTFDDASDQTRFFYQFYAPMIRNILELTEKRDSDKASVQQLMRHN